MIDQTKMTLRDQFNYLLRVKQICNMTELSKLSGVSASHISNMLRGMRPMTHIEEMAAPLGYKVILVPIDQSDEDKDGGNG